MRARSLLVALCSAALVAGSATAALADPGDYRQVVDLTFPTVPPSDRTPIEQLDGTSYGFVDDYHHARSNGCGVHRATDVFGEAGQPVHAAVGGEITFMPDPAPHYGWMIRVAGDDGRTYNYVHLGADGGPRDEAYAAGLDVGDRVERGQHIGYLGSSGNASAELPHLHFEIGDDEVAGSNQWSCPYINPYESLKAAVERGDLPDGAAAASGRVDRLAGAERVATAAALSRDAFPDGAAHAVIASAHSFPDAIVAGPLAAALDGPVLTTYRDGLHHAAAEELRRLDVERVTLVDGTRGLSQAVVTDLREQVGLPGDAVEVVDGDSPFVVAARVARRVRALTGSDDALVALGEHPQPHRSWPDALTAGYHGAVVGQPVLLVTYEAVPEATARALDGVATATIIGGPAAVSEELEDGIGERAGEVRRLFGTNRYGTAAAAAGALLDAGAVSADRLWAATGRDFADALAAATTVASHGDALVLVDGQVSDGDAPLDDWLAGRQERFARGRVIGGTDAVTDEARTLLAERIR